MLNALTIKTLGELKVLRDGSEIKLPQSKRTRALLAYLAVNARPHRRDRLCEIFWEVPDDPRGALRWSLSKLRPVVNDDDLQRLVADRERVTLLTADVDLDIKTISATINDANTRLENLEALAAALAEPFLDGLELAEQSIYQQWLTAERRELERLHAKLLSRLACHGDLTLSAQLAWTERWETLEPFNPQVATLLLSQLAQLGDTAQMSSVETRLTRRFRNAGIAWSPSARVEVAQGVTDTLADDMPEQRSGRELLERQKIRFCTAKDGVNIAYASIGSGKPIVKAANWLSHLEHDWESPIWSPLFRQLATDHHFIRYDERGNGLSDWEAKDISFESFVTDLETVVDACQVEQFALLGISQGAAVSIEYAVRHPERVSRLILFGGYAAGWRLNASEALIAEREAVMTLTKTGWGQDNPAYRQIFSSTFMPSANLEELAWFNEFQRLTTSPANAVRFLSVFADIDVRERLAQVQVPTLVIHSMHDQRIPVASGRNLAAAIPDAEFISLDSDGHLLLGREPASAQFVSAVRDFID